MFGFKDFLKDENGQGMVEYALLIGGIAIGVVVILIAMRPKITEKMNKINNQVDLV